MKLTKTKLKQIIKEDATNTGGGYGDAAQETLIALKKQYVPKGTPTINFHEIAAAVFNNMTRG